VERAAGDIAEKTTKKVKRLLTFFYNYNNMSVSRQRERPRGVRHMETMTFNTKQEAQEYIKTLEEAVYYLQHGEYGRPHYKARKIRNKPCYGIYVYYNFCMGTYKAIKNGFLKVY
jgi:hypothetical protein